MGRVLQSTQTTAGAPGPYQMSYGYDLAGDKTSETYPSGRVVTTSYDAAGRISQVSGQKAGSGSKVYSSSYSYSPHGGVTGVSLAGGAMRETMIYNSRLQATQTELRIQSTNALLLGLDYTFSQTNNNGNLQSQTIRIGASITINQTYSYDQVNRLQSATETGAWTQSYGYDQYGNRWVSGMNDYIPPASQGLTPLNQNAFNAATNRIVASQYDTSGNQTQDGRGNQYTYDSENRQLTFNTTVGRYYYDGGGNRVKVEGMTGVIYVYDIMGQLVAEYTSVAAANEGTSYLTTDHLGSTRLVMSGGANPAVKARYDYLPFGEEIGAGIGGRTTAMGYSPGQGEPRQKFTSKERDSESGLDYFLARYYSSAQGRFASPDPYIPVVNIEKEKEFKQYLAEPRNWNRYVYVWDNPLRYIDPFGEKVYVVTYTTGNARGDEEFKRVAETRAQEIRNSEGFDREKDTIILRGVKTKEDFEGVIMEANGLEDKYGKIDEISLVSHSGSGDGPTFQFGTPQRSQYPKERLSQLWFNWSKTAEARFFGCNTAVNFCQNFANAQGVPSWGFDTFSSLSGRPDQKSKFYWVQSWVTPWVQTRRYMVGREDGRGMVRRDPAPKDRSRR